MAQNIHLSDRVRFLPGLKKKDLPPMFDSIFVGTVYMSLTDSWLPASFSNWQEDKFFNYSSIIATRNNGGTLIDGGPGIISDLDYNIFQYGSGDTPLSVINPSLRNNRYPFYYKENVKEDGSHSGFVFYTVYDVERTADVSSGKWYYSLAVDIWESKILLNDASDYEEFN